mmetsp:Transcript_21202/g.55292  ORF Transcript_21202/g.55292 Transcript_21202/m.55292 type:complete len:295 (-) Transcript_21202:170-1054(-)
MVGWGCEMDDARSTTHPASTGASVIKHMPSADNASSHCKSPWSDPVTVAHFSRRSDWSVVTAAPSAGTAAETIEQSSTLPGVQLPIGGNCSKRCSASHALQNLETVPSFAQCIANVAPSSQTLNLRAAHGGANIAVSIATFWPDSGSKIVGQLCRSHDVFTSRTRWRCDTPGPSNTNDKVSCAIACTALIVTRLADGRSGVLARLGSSWRGGGSTFGMLGACSEDGGDGGGDDSHRDAARSAALPVTRVAPWSDQTADNARRSIARPPLLVGSVTSYVGTWRSRFQPLDGLGRG